MPILYNVLFSTWFPIKTIAIFHQFLMQLQVAVKHLQQFFEFLSSYKQKPCF